LIYSPGVYKLWRVWKLSALSVIFKLDTPNLPKHQLLGLGNAYQRGWSVVNMYKFPLIFHRFEHQNFSSLGMIES
jgi:hypothetical protein